MKELGLRTERGVPVSWPRTKRELILSGYTIKDKMKVKKGVRKSYSIITL